MRWLLATTLAVTVLFGCRPGDDDSSADDDTTTSDDDSTSDDDTTGDDELPFDFKAACATEWPSDECASGDCTDSDVEQRYADAWELWFQGMSGLTAEEMEPYARLRRVDTFEAQYSSYTDIYYQLQVDWVRLVFWQGVSAEGGDPTTEEIVAEMTAYHDLPQVDFQADLVPFEEIQAFVDDCAATHGVTFDSSGWCDPGVPTNPGDDDLAIKFFFWADLESGGNRYAYASVDAMGNDEPDCGIDKWPWDDSRGFGFVNTPDPEQSMPTPAPTTNR